MLHWLCRSNQRCPVVASYLGVLLAMLFMAGMKITIQDETDYRKALAGSVNRSLNFHTRGEAVPLSQFAERPLFIAAFRS